MLFSELFNIDKAVLSEYGAVDISLHSDTPLFIDPLLIYRNDNPEIKKLYSEIVKYLLFLKKKSVQTLTPKEINYYYSFKEVKQNWLGLSSSGNEGLALGNGFASELFSKISEICNTHNISESPHIEKMFVINGGVGKDKISDWSANILKSFFVEYTERFAYQYIDPKYCKKMPVEHCSFNYEVEVFEDRIAYLPVIKNRKNRYEYVLLTPASILRKDDQEISLNHFEASIEDIVFNTISNDELRHNVNTLIQKSVDALYEIRRQKSEAVPLSDIKEARKNGLLEAIQTYPELIDYYIKNEEDKESLLIETAKAEREYVLQTTNENPLTNSNIFGVGLLTERDDAFEEACERVTYFKNQIEVNSCYKNLYYNDEPINDERFIQRLFKMVWYKSLHKFAPESDSGAGPVDFLITKGALNSCLIEFKLASNKKLSSVYNQVSQYKKSHSVGKAVIVIFAFNHKEMEKALSVKNENKTEDLVVVVDCDKDTKKSASKL